ncbi:S8 family serine peptidase [Actinomadura sp. NEAU-AAG5]|uniref:S8 family serine peptidase n=1 Tax=Actinomadura litoris TaxID=2678616 RepID=A0A7K1L8M6_9ACTN|nr:S8 family serine peptidase [Actinomadura litoris]
MRAIELKATGLLLAMPLLAPPPSPSGTPRPPSPSPVTQAPCDPPRGNRAPFSEPWAQRRLAFQRAWPFTRGEGVTVAVIDSGADATHPMLAGRVARSTDLTGTGDRDCAGHGTGVAALIAGRDLSARGLPLTGVAPASRLLVYKQQNGDHEEKGGERLPRAIREAADAGADVINISIAAGDSPALEQAVRYAQGRNAVIVAAAGNTTTPDGAEGPSYPASYPGVVSVASLGEDGQRVESSGLRSRVDVGAPGEGITVPWPNGGFNPQAQGTSYAAAYVSGTAALVRARHPLLRQDQVVHRILTTADGNTGTATGSGMVNPVQAVTALIPEEAAGTALRQPSPRPARLVASPPEDGRTHDRAVVLAAGALGLAALAALCGVVLPLGRRRGWRPGKAVISVPRDEDEPVPPPSGRGGIGAS